MNKKKTVLLTAGFGAMVFIVFGVIFSLVGGPFVGFLLGLVAAAAWLAVGWVRGESLVLDLSDAELIDEVAHARLINVTSGLCLAVGVSVPDLYVADDPGLNALAVGRSQRRASLVFTQGLLDELNLVELEAIVSLLLHKVKTEAIVAETFAVPTVGATCALGVLSEDVEWLSRILTSPTPLVESVLARLHSSRGELDTDLAAVDATRYPPALASALKKMDGRSALTVASPVTAHLWLAPPLGVNTRPAVARMHAPLSERVAVLQEL